MKTYPEVVAEIDSLACAVLPNSIPPDSVLDEFGCHRNYIMTFGNDRIRIYGFASAATRDAFVTHYAADGAHALQSFTNDSA